MFAGVKFIDKKKVVKGLILEFYTLRCDLKLTETLANRCDPWQFFSFVKSNLKRDHG
jgi:hypothetical protein